jgi:polyisoprenoid-binding protein YceI
MTTTANPIVTWKIDPAHSRAEFKVKHMMISNVRGSFSDLNGTLIEDTAATSPLGAVRLTKKVAIGPNLGNYIFL